MTATQITRRSAVCMAGALAFASAAQAQTGAARQVAFDSAMADYAHGHFAAAHAAFWQLADQGNADAARIALLMSAYGQRMYGMRFPIGDVQRERWLANALPRTGGTATAMAR